MQVLSNTVIYSDGKHNAFTSMVRWRGRFWVAFRNGTHHRSHDGRVLVISSPDLEHWSEPVVAIDTPADDRDPKLVVYHDRLYVATASVIRSFSDETKLDGLINTTAMQTSMSSTIDGQRWDEPWFATEPYHFIWWMRQYGGTLYASQRKAKKVVENGVQVSDYDADFLHSRNGRRWQRLSLISNERMASEVAFDFLADGRAVAFVRHDLDQYPEIKVAEPPYTQWQTVMTFPFRCNGPSLDVLGGRIVISARAFFEDAATPLLTPELAPRLRGLLLMTVDLAKPALEPHLLIPHSTGPLAADDPGADEDARFNAPDISYASAVDMGGGAFVMSYYDGYKGRRSQIRLLRVAE